MYCAARVCFLRDFPNLFFSPFVSDETSPSMLFNEERKKKESPVFLACSAFTELI